MFYQLILSIMRSNTPMRLGYDQLRDFLPASFNDLCISLSPYSLLSPYPTSMAKNVCMRRSPLSVKPRSKIYSKNPERAASANDKKQVNLKVYNDSFNLSRIVKSGIHTGMDTRSRRINTLHDMRD